MYEKNIRSWLKHIDFILLDLLSITLSFTVAYFIRQGIGLGLRDDVSYRGFYLVLVGFHILIAFFFRSYSSIVRRDHQEEIKEITKQNLLMLGCTLLYLVFTKQSEFYSRLFLGYLFVCNYILMNVFHFMWKKIIRSRHNKKEKLDRLLVITNRLQAEKCLKKLNNMSYQAFTIIGIVLLDGSEDIKEISGTPVVAYENSMMEYVRLNVVDQVLIQMNESLEGLNKIANQFLDMGIVVHISLEETLENLPHKQVHEMGGLTVITTSIQAASMMELFLKRAMDICGAMIGILFTAIVFLFIAPIIYIKSPGPIFFSQYRMGKNGRRFKLYKFRSMYMDAEERKKELMSQNKMQGFMFKMDNDPRIIKGVGNFIRNTSLDELPQFWNILKGDMSLVGTRPPTVDEFEQYELHHKVRLSFRPGLTGMWQVNGRSDITDFEEVVRLDEEYIAHWSIWLDVKIIFKTIEVVLKRRGSE